MRKYILAVLLILVSLVPVSAQQVYWHPIEGKEASSILVPGSRPLTVGMQNALLNCIEFGLSLALTQAEEESLRSALMQEYLSFKTKLIADLADLGKLWNQIQAANPGERTNYRRLMRESLYEELAKNPSSDIGRILGDLQKNSSELVVEGNPKIDKRSIASFLEIVQMALRLRDKRVVSWNAADLAALEKDLVRRIPELTPEGRRWLSNADFHRAIIAKSWQKVAADEKETIKGLLVETFAPRPDPEGAGLVDLKKIPLPPPNLFPLPADLPWEMR